MESDTLPEKICFVADQSENIFTESDSGAAQIEENQEMHIVEIHDLSATRHGILLKLLRQI